MSFYIFARALVRFGMKFVYKFEVSYAEPIPDNRGMIVAANHQSNMDPVVLGCVMKRPVCYMAKEELFAKPILGKILVWVDAFKVSRGSGDASALDTAVQLVADGKMLGIFPEGTRSKDGELHRAKSGIVVVASKSGGDIVPVGISYGERKFIRRMVTIKFGKIITNDRFMINEHDRHEIRVASAVIMDNIAKMLGKKPPSDIKKVKDQVVDTKKVPAND